MQTNESERQAENAKQEAENAKQEAENTEQQPAENAKEANEAAKQAYESARQASETADRVEDDGKTVFWLKSAIRVLAIVILSIMVALLIIFGATYIANRDHTFPVRIGEDTDGISLSKDYEMTEPTTHLNIPVIDDLDNISRWDIPTDVDSLGGGVHSGTNYIAYTFYLKNNLEESASIREKINILSVTKHADQAIRVQIYRDGVDSTYAAMSAAGTPEYGTEPFVDAKTVHTGTMTMAAGQIKRYTIVIWIEGDDPECVNEIGGGSVRLNIEFTMQ